MDNDTSMDRLTIEIESTSKDSASEVDLLIAKLSKLKTELQNVVSASGNFSRLKSNISTASRGVRSGKSTKTTTKKPFAEYGSMSSQLKNLGIESLDEPFAKLKSSIETTNGSTQKFITSNNQLVTVTKRSKNGVEGVKVSVQQLNNEQRKSTGIFKTFTSGITGTITKLGILGLGVSKIAQQVAGYTTQASAYEESLNLFTVTLGENAKQALQWVERFSDALYLDPANVMQYMGSFNSLVKGLGVGAEKSYLMSKNLTQLTYDLASFKNLDFDTAFLKLQSAISGEIEPLRNVGVALSQATLQELANSLGIQQRVAEMSEAQKAQLRYIQIMKSSSEWQTDMGRTLVTPMNALRVLKQQFLLLARAIGNVFIPIIMKVVPYIMVLTKWLTILANKIASLFGYQIQDIDYSGISAGLGDIGGGIADIGDEADSTAKKLNTMLAPFDELNVVQNKTEGGGGSGGLGGVGGGDLGLPLPEYDALAGLTDKLKKNMKIAEDNLKKFLNIAKKVAIVLGTIWAVGKLLKFADALDSLFKLFKTGNVTSGVFSETIKNMGLRFATAYKSTGKLTAGLKALLSPTQKVVLGLTAYLGGTILAGKSTKEMGKTNEVTTKSFLGLSGGIASATAGGAMLGSVIPGVGTAFGGLLGFLTGATVALGGWNKGVNEAIRTEAGKNLFGTLTISTSEFKTMLENLNPTANATAEKIERLRQSVISADTGFKENLNTVETYLFRFGTLGEQITNESGPQFLSSLQAMFDNANKIIDTSTQYSLELWTSGLMQMNTISVKGQEEILSRIETNSEWAKQKLESAQSIATSTFEKGMRERGYLTEEEKNTIQKALDDIANISRTKVSSAEGDLLVLQQQFNSESGKLSRESYKNYAKALEDYQKQRKEEIQKEYKQRLSSAEEQYRIELLRLQESGISKTEAEKTAGKHRQEAIDSANAMVVESNKKVEKETKEFSQKLTSNLVKEYNNVKGKTKKEIQETKKIIEGIFKDLHLDTNQLQRTCEQAGRDANKAFKNGFGSLKIEGSGGVSVNGSNAITFKPRAEGGFPKTGEFFVARENGIPEMIGQIGNRTAVANNDQITTSITNALMSALSGVDFGGSKSPTTIYIGNKKVYEGYGDHIERENDRYGTNMIRI